MKKNTTSFQKITYNKILTIMTRKKKSTAQIASKLRKLAHSQNCIAPGPKPVKKKVFIKKRLYKQLSLFDYP